MSPKDVTVFAVGDLMLGMPEADSYFTHVAPVLRSGDVVIGHSEIPYTKSQFKTRYGGSPPQDPERLAALNFAGFNVVTMASNLLWDYGAPGVLDPIAWLRGHGIATVGAGKDLVEARRPAIIARGKTRVGILNYSCLGPKNTWATSAKPGGWSVDKPGCAYVQVITHYEEDPIAPWRPPNVYTWAEHGSVQAMVDDITRLRPLCEVLIVVLHKGVINVPIDVAQHERLISYAAVDAGADLILSHHAHILKGVELYKGKVIFHGLGNFVAVTSMTPAEWDRIALMRREVFHFEADPEYRTYLFHPEAKATVIAKCAIREGRISSVGFLPCWINKLGQPEVLKNDQKGQEVFEYMEKITRGAGLNGQFRWQGDEIVVPVE